MSRLTTEDLCSKIDSLQNQNQQLRSELQQQTKLALCRQYQLQRTELQLQQLRQRLQQLNHQLALQFEEKALLQQALDCAQSSLDEKLHQSLPLIQSPGKVQKLKSQSIERQQRKGMNQRNWGELLSRCKHLRNSTVLELKSMGSMSLSP